MFQHKIITLLLISVFIWGSVSPAAAGYVYVPDPAVQTTQTVVYQQIPPQTVVIRESIPPVYVRESPCLSEETLLMTGVGTLVGGILLENIWDSNHHHSYHPAPLGPVFNRHRHFKLRHRR